MTRAATTHLEPGQHSIDRVKPFQRAGRDGWTIKWHLRLHNGRMHRDNGTFTTGRTKGEARAKAKKLADEALRAGAKARGTGTWKPSSSALDYLDEVVLPHMRAAQLDASTLRRYELAYRLLRGECSATGCTHASSMAGLTLWDAMQPANLLSCLEEIAELHGAVNTKHAKTVARWYFAERLKVDGIITVNPVSDLRVSTARAKPVAYRRGGQALSLAQYRAVID